MADRLQAEVRRTAAEGDQLRFQADGVLLRRFESPAEPYPLAWPPYLTFIQPELERALRANCKRFPNLTLRTATELVGLENPDRPVLTLHDKVSGERSRRSARYVVGCDGANSMVRKSLFGREFPGFTWDSQIIATNTYYDFEGKFGFHDANFIIHPEHFFVSLGPATPGLRITNPC